MIFHILLVLIFIRPFISSLDYLSLDTYYTFSLIFLSLLFLISKKELAKSFPGQGYLLLCFLAIIASAFFSFQPIKSLKELPKFLSYFFIFYATYYAEKLEKKKIILTIIFTASCVSAYAIYWFYCGSLNLLEYMKEKNIIYPYAEQFLTRRRAFIPFVLPSMLAGYLIMMLPLGTGFLFKENKRCLFNFKYTFPILSVMLICFALLLTKSIGAFLCLFLSFLIFIILSRQINEKTVLLLLILQLTFMSFFFWRSFKTEYFTSSLFSIQNRLIYWQNTLAVILKYPFRGVGLGNLPFVQSQFAHNSYLQIWAELGILGIFSFLGFLYKSLKTIKPERLVADKLYAGLIITHFSFLIHNLIDFSFFLPEVSLFWWIIVALILGSSYSIKPE